MASYTRTTTVDSGPTGDTTKQAVLDLDTDLGGAASGLIAAYNAHDAATTNVHGCTGTATGTGALVRATSPTLVTPILGAATATTVNKITITQPASGSTLTIVDGKTLHYEDGTWTPVLKFGTTVQNNSNSCTYTKIGNKVFISGSITWTAAGGTGAVSIEGLPFSNGDSSTAVLMAGCAAGKITATDSLFYNIDPGSTILHLANQAGDITDASMVAGTITVMGHYKV